MTSDFKGIAVLAEYDKKGLLPISRQLLSEARRLGDILKEPVSAVLIGNAEESLSESCFNYGADEVILIEDPRLKEFNVLAYTRAMTAYIQAQKPAIVLFGATTYGKDISARTAVRLKTGLTADAIILDIDPETRLLLQTRPAFGGNIMATITCPQARPQLCTIRASVCEEKVSDTPQKGSIKRIIPEFLPEDFRVTLKEIIPRPASNAPLLEEAHTVIAGGRGINKETFEKLQELALVLGGVVGATRPPVDAGFLSHDYQIGQTGKTIRPKVYIACGISGAVQHTIGIQDSGLFIAINKDPDAPIFKFADIGIVGQAEEIIPLLITALKGD